MVVPLLDISRQHAPLRDQLDAAYRNVMDTGGFVMGPEVQAFEKEIANYTQTAYAIGMSSGTDALLVALMAMGIGPGDEVLCPAFSFFATAGGVVRLGATPVWVDVLPDTFNIDLADAEAKISPKTKAIIPVHLFGQACDMECVQALASQYNLLILEDAAQSLGAEYNNQPVGGFGHFGAYSFYPTKNLGGFGDGGMIVTQIEELASKAIWLRNHGMNPRYHHKFVGGNFRLDAIQAALLRVKLPWLESYHNARAANARIYSQELASIQGLILPSTRDACRCVWNQYTLRVKGGRRDAFRSFLQQQGIGTEVYYPITLDQQECMAGVGRGGDSVANSHRIAAEVVSIPIFPEMTQDEQAYVIDVIKNFFAV